MQLKVVILAGADSRTVNVQGLKDILLDIEPYLVHLLGQTDIHRQCRFR
jgi:hypothetical protein